jgi:hypothetical protein
MSKEIKAKARVQITVEVEVSIWGCDCTIGQLYKQAAADGVSKIQNAIIKSEYSISLVGEPSVIGIITESIK